MPNCDWITERRAHDWNCFDNTIITTTARIECSRARYRRLRVSLTKYLEYRLRHRRENRPLVEKKRHAIKQAAELITHAENITKFATDNYAAARYAWERRHRSPYELRTTKHGISVTYDYVKEFKNAASDIATADALLVGVEETLRIG